MKNKINLILIFILTALILSACNNNANLKESVKHKIDGITLSDGWMRPAAI